MPLQVVENASAPKPFTQTFTPEESTQSKATVAPRILIVEDDYLAAMDAEMALIDAGFQVTGIAGSAEEALLLAHARPPALVLMDIRLRGTRDGIDVAIELFQSQRVRCLFATAHHDAHTRQRAEAAQPLGWLAKPYSVQSLVAAVRRALEAIVNRR